jgi:glutathione synthase/RimK-type ligase-like ATP-grasp enzyme
MIAIHNSEIGFHPRWINYCKKMNIPFKLVDCYSNSIINDLKECDALIWHFWQTGPKDNLVAKRLLAALQHSGKVVFPDFKTSWHFDDKISQKYLLEALGLPLVKSYFFVDKKDALDWVEKTSFPKVFKLKGGAGSANVSLIKSKSSAKSIIKQAFSSGFSQFDSFGFLIEGLRKFNLGKINTLSFLKVIYRSIFPPKFSKLLGKEIYHAYFQDFLANNDSDYRVIVIDAKAFAIKRFVRENDFRASGSGNISYDKQNFSDDLIQKSIAYAEILNMQVVAFDLIKDENLEYKIVEISYGYAIDAYDGCVGYWDKNLNFHEGRFDSCEWMIDLVVKKINANKID